MQPIAIETLTELGYTETCIVDASTYFVAADILSILACSKARRSKCQKSPKRCA
jgi:hypothetical protein